MSQSFAPTITSSLSAVKTEGEDEGELLVGWLGPC